MRLAQQSVEEYPIPPNLIDVAGPFPHAQLVAVVVRRPRIAVVHMAEIDAGLFAGVVVHGVPSFLSVSVVLFLTVIRL